MGALSTQNCEPITEAIGEGAAFPKVTSAMIEAGAQEIYDADWEFSADAEAVAERVYRVMASLSVV